MIGAEGIYIILNVFFSLFLLIIS